jgi:hypothetical protein
MIIIFYAQSNETFHVAWQKHGKIVFGITLQHKMENGHREHLGILNLKI